MSESSKAVTPRDQSNRTLDLPLSLVADIVMLPYTVPAQLIWGNFEFDNPRFGSSSPEVF